MIMPNKRLFKFEVFKTFILFLSSKSQIVCSFVKKTLSSLSVFDWYPHSFIYILCSFCSTERFRNINIEIAKKKKIFILIEIQRKRTLWSKFTFQMIICVCTQKIWKTKKFSKLFLFVHSQRKYQWNAHCFPFCFIRSFFVPLSKMKVNCWHFFDQINYKTNIDINSLFYVYNYFVLSWEKRRNFNYSEIIPSMTILIVSFKKLNNWKSYNNTLFLFIILRMSKV